MRSPEVRELEGRTPFLLDQPDVGWVVRSGRVDVFAVEVVGGEAAGRRHPLCSVEPGDLLVGVEPTAEFAVLGVGVAPTTVERIALAEVASHGDGLQLVERWAERLAGALRQPEEEHVVTLVASEPVELSAGARARSARGTVWVEGERLTVLGMPGAGWVPVPPGAWVEAPAAVSLTPRTAAGALAASGGYTGLAVFGRAVLGRVAADAAAEREEVERRLDRLEELDAELGIDVYGELADVVRERHPPVPAAPGDGSLLAACRLVGRAAGFEVVEPTRSGALAAREPLAAIARSSGLRTREVALDTGWWRRDAGPLLGSIAEDGRPVALIPRRPGRYELFDPQKGSRVRVGHAATVTLTPRAHAFYRPLPARRLGGRELLRFAMRDARRDGVRLLALGFAAGLLSLLPPIVAGVLFEHVVPAGQERRLAGLSVLLVAAAVAAASFAIVQGLASLRLEGRVSTPLQAAIWDRLLGLPVPFYRRYTSGDLATRGLGVEAIRETISTATTTAVLAGFLALSNVVLLFAFNALLALVALAAVLVAVGVLLLLCRSMVPQQRRLQEARGHVFGTGVQLFGGIAKLRVANAETRAFAVWGHWFARMKRAFYRAQRRYVALTTFSAAWPLLGTALVFLAAARLPGATISPGEFLAFNTAFQQAVAGIALLATAVVALAGALPVWERTRPIFQALPETEAAHIDPGQLQGAIDVSHVSFRYAPDGPLVLDDVSLRADPGEFVALVGPSGAGKSSLLRLLLGFEQPETGTVEYDGKSLGDLDVRTVRHQMGVVVQNARLLPGSIFQNIVGSSIDLTLDDAWEAARIAGLDEDIRAMPMGMQTFVSEGASTFSGGQRQRILIARAVVGKPRILLFDEATSALDNRTQASVTASLERLRATRVVIAHRLSTIRGADRIVVLQGGRVVQCGTYAELAGREGPFADIARRQLA
ncbi:MAG: NHLP bacteriocin export ABC transporter permease/ATPase subunit [Thermoleophilaceae bacterium]|nr:NHLP bacteriocin export ABC transporter permease/ATPase subunit [Thermoleophilaceae bacterium]